MLAARDCPAAVAAGFGPEQRTGPFARALLQAAAMTGLKFTEVPRAWSYLYGNADCCPLGGTSYDLAPDPQIRAIVDTAGIRVLPSRDALAATIAPATGDEADAMRAATCGPRAVPLVSRCALPTPGTGPSAGLR